MWVAPRSAGPPTASAHGHLGSASNNVAEYRGLRACMRRAVREPDRDLVFRVDSLLVAHQQMFVWACRAKDIVAIYHECMELGEALTQQGKQWRIDHVYREYNATADKLANEGVDDPEEFVIASGPW